MRRLLFLPVLLLAVASIPVAHAQSGSVCQFSAHVTLDPGVSATPGAGTFTTDGETGTLSCQGDIAGDGTIGYVGTYGTGATGDDTCALGSGSGDLSYTVGDATAAGGFSFARLAVGGGFMADDMTIVGTFVFQPDDGQDCVTVPVTGATVSGQVILAY